MSPPAGQPGQRSPADRAPRLLVVHGPGLDLTRRGLETPAPGTAEVLEGWLAGWAAEVGARVSSVTAPGEAEVVAAASTCTADGLAVVAGDLAFTSSDLGEAAGRLAAAGVPVVDLHLRDLRRAGADPRASLLAGQGARVIHGRGIEGYRWALAHLAWSSAWPAAVEAYGQGSEQVGDLRVPAGPGPHPVALLLHGGFWLEPWGRDLLDGLAVDLSRRGWATYNTEYRRLGAGGGWPEMLADAEAALAHALAHLDVLAAEHPLEAGGVLLAGHSAGAHLALRLAAEIVHGRAMPGAVEVAGVLALAPLADLTAAREHGLGGGAVERLLDTAPLAEVSPLVHLPLGLPQLVAHCADDLLVPVSQGQDWATAARAAGDPVTLLTLPAGGHFSLTSPGSTAWEAVARLLPLLG